MKIIFLLNSPYPFYTGGRETWIYNLCNRLCEDYDITIITQDNRKNNDTKAGVFLNIDKRITIRPVLAVSSYCFLRKYVRRYLRCFNDWITSLSMKKEIQKIVESNQEDFVIIAMNTLYLATTANWAKKKYKNVFSICSVRSKHAEVEGKNYPLMKNIFRNIENKNLTISDIIWANGYDTRDYLEKRGISSIVIKNGVDFENNDTVLLKSLNSIMQIDGPKIINIGTLIDIKGYRELISAISQIHKEYGCAVHLIALGKGDSSRYEQIAKDLGVKEFIHFIGEDRRTISYCQNADLVTCLSGGAGLSMACLEALSSKTPVIAWDTAVYRQLIDHMTSGYLVEENSIDELARGIMWLIDHKKDAKIMADNAYKVASQYDWHHVVNDVKTSISHINIHN